MKKQTVLVTGASSGIGKGVAKYFLDRGYNVVINSKTPEKLQKVFEEFGAGENLAMAPGDVSSKTTGEEMVKVALEKFGSVDVLINNAGMFESKPFLEVDEAYLDRMLDLNLKGSFFTMQAAIAQMVKQKAGAVVHIGTSLVNHAITEWAHSAQLVSKAPINSLTVHLAAEFGHHNIRVNTVAPGVIRTPMHNGNADQAAPMHLLKRVGEIEDVAAMVYTVANSQFTTGAIIYVDGGLGSGHAIKV